MITSKTAVPVNIFDRHQAHRVIRNNARVQFEQKGVVYDKRGNELRDIKVSTYHGRRDAVALCIGGRDYKNNGTPVNEKSDAQITNDMMLEQDNIEKAEVENEELLGQITADAEAEEQTDAEAGDTPGSDEPETDITE